MTNTLHSNENPLDVRGLFPHKGRAATVLETPRGPSNPTGLESRMRLNPYATGASRVQRPIHIGDAAVEALADIVARSRHFRLQLLDDAIATFDPDGNETQFSRYVELCDLYHRADRDWPMERAAARDLTRQCLAIIASKAAA